MDSLLKLQRVAIVLLVLAVVKLCGCGPKPAGPIRHEASGRVIFSGTPVSAGVIFFNPKAAEYGGGTAPITDGRYDTRERGGRGHLGGLHTIRIVAEPPDDWDGGDFQPPFPPYEVEQELPMVSGVLNYEVPGGKKK